MKPEWGRGSLTSFRPTRDANDSSKASRRFLSAAPFVGAYDAESMQGRSNAGTPHQTQFDGQMGFHPHRAENPSFVGSFTGALRHCQRY